MFMSVFLNNLIMDDYRNISDEILKGIKELFFRLNQQDGYLEITDKSLDKFKVNRPDAIVGMDFFWNVLINNQDEKVKFEY